jgi:hypothetical protein
MVGKLHNLRGTVRAVKRLPEYPGKVAVVLETDGREERLLFPEGDPRLAALKSGARVYVTARLAEATWGVRTYDRCELREPEE